MLRSALAAILAVLLAGCISVYRMDIAQGNIVTPQQIEQLKLGMTRSQVRFVLGTPLVADSFHADRWDYFYSLRKGTESKPATQRLTVTFKGDVLASIDGDIAGKSAGATP